MSRRRSENANLAQVVNVIAPILTRGDAMLLNPSFIRSTCFHGGARVFAQPMSRVRHTKAKQTDA
jgi:alpha-L-arabinofuranosidase